MRSKLFISGLLASALMVPALGQSSGPNPTPPVAPPAATAPIAPRPVGELWRSSKLIGLDIYNDQNEKLGDITEVLVDRSGNVAGIVIGVGGFLGMGQHDILVDMAKLKFVNEAARSTSTSTTTTTGSGRPATTTTTRTDPNRWYPDHAILGGVTKDQLKAIPQFKFD